MYLSQVYCQYYVYEVGDEWTKNLHNTMSNEQPILMFLGLVSLDILSELYSIYLNISVIGQ